MLRAQVRCLVCPYSYTGSATTAWRRSPLTPPASARADPDDLAWRKQIQPTGPCPPGRRPYHTILTAQNSLYQQWQTKIFYYHFRRVQREGPYGGRCTAARSKCC